MAWKKASAEMREFLEQAVASLPCQRRVMFGNPVYFANENMLAGLHGDDLFIRLSERDREAVLAANAEVTRFEPVPGMAMKEYVVLPPSLYREPTSLAEWLDRSLQYVSSLPPKKSKSKKKA